MAGYLERLKLKKRQGEVLPKLPKVKKDENMPNRGTAKTAKRAFDSKDSKGSGHISKIPAPEPAGMGIEYGRFWNEAWTLADWIDNPAAAPIEERLARLPELDRMRERMAEIVRQAVPTANPEPSDGVWHPWESSNTTTGELTLESCPARCRRTGKCHARAYFEGKAGKAIECNPDDCRWIH